MIIVHVQLPDNDSVGVQEKTTLAYITRIDRVFPDLSVRQQICSRHTLAQSLEPQWCLKMKRHYYVNYNDESAI